MRAHGEVGRDGDLDLARKEVVEGLVVFGGLGGEKVAYDDGKGEVVLGVEGGKLAKGCLEFAMDVANDKTIGKQLLAQKILNVSMFRFEGIARVEGGLASWELPLLCASGSQRGIGWVGSVRNAGRGGTPP